MSDLYRHARFLVSVPKLKLAPADTGIEVAFAGRSNAGKSSAINTITSQKALARTSKTPGRTQHLVFFEIDEARRFVDLPGYGYAKVPQQIQKQWRIAMEQYFTKRTSLRGIFLIMDIRHPMTPFDLQMIKWCGHCEKRLHLVLTKSDKIAFGAAKTTILQIKKALAENNFRASVQLFSALKHVGIEEAHQVLNAWFELEPERADSDYP